MRIMVLLVTLAACTAGGDKGDTGDAGDAGNTGNSGDSGDTGETVDAPGVTASAGDLTCNQPYESVVSAIDPGDLPQGPSPCRVPMLARVVSVTDGDTIHVKPAEGGTEETVRLIGVDTPEVGDAADCYGPEASDFTNATLYKRLVWLTFDFDCEDIYDRTLAYVSLSTDASCLFERLLLRGGYAETMNFSATSTFNTTFADDEDWARGSDEGMWGACN